MVIFEREITAIAAANSTARESMAFSQDDKFLVQPHIDWKGQHSGGYVIAMYSRNDNFCGYY